MIDYLQYLHIIRSDLITWICYIHIVCVCVCVRARSVVSDFCDPMDCGSPGFFNPWDFPGKKTAVDFQFLLLQGIFLAQGSNPHLLSLLHWQVDPLSLSHLRSPFYIYSTMSKLNYSFLLKYSWLRILH